MGCEGHLDHERVSLLIDHTVIVGMNVGKVQWETLDEVDEALSVDVNVVKFDGKSSDSR